MGFTTATANNILASLLCTNLDSSNTECWLGLSMTIPNPDGQNFIEPSPGPSGYQRILIGSTSDVNARAMSIPSNGMTINIKDIIFPEATNNYSIIYVGLFRESTGGTPFYIIPCASLINVETGKSIVFKEGNLSFSSIEMEE